eukprot:TRINITY_DN11452_c0_g2_i1.p1 TRINITY_DN11452_c0_g2~~TRINITY_DN11452_c0_g2_i1.p1  ORF type:complete len:556 (+),score=111.14 TRINITY_DN11452_c0_g2_i1:94-1668(+)
MTTYMKTLLRGTTAAAVCIAATAATSSSHREAPGITEQPKVDATDFYMFRSYETGREGYVTFIANYQPLQAPYGGPNYFTMDPDALYEIHIDNDGDAVEDLTFQFEFDNDLANGGAGISLDIGGENVPIPLRTVGPIDSNDGNLNELESYTLTMVRGDRRSNNRTELGTFRKPLDYVGEKTFGDNGSDTNYEAYADGFINSSVSMDGCDNNISVFVGQREEAFAVNLGEIFDLVNLTPIQGPFNAEWPEYGSGDSGIQQNRANDDLIGKANVTTLAIEVPIDCLTEGDDPVIGAWTTASLPQAELEDPSPTYEATSKFGGAWVQQSRLSAPLVNEVVIGLPDKDLFNAAQPTQDGALAVYVTNPTLPAILEVLFGEAGIEAPKHFPRNDLVSAFLTGFEGVNAPANPDAEASEMLRLNTETPVTAILDQNAFGVLAGDNAGFPNGRRPGDDVVDIALRVVMGVLCHTDLAECTPEDAPSGQVPFTDGAPLKAEEFRDSFPYLNTPLPGSPQEAQMRQWEATLNQ